MIFDYLNDKLFSFDFTPDEIAEIAEYADIEGHMEANREAQMDNDRGYEALRGREDKASSNEIALVEDLFQRD